MKRAARILPLLFALAPAIAQAHSIGASPDLDAPWWSGLVGDMWDVLLLAGVSLSFGLYTAGLIGLWRRAGVGRVVPRWGANCFYLGWLVCIFALYSFVDELGDDLFFMHMIQHELLMIFAAPLLVVGRPALVFLWAAPARWRRAIGRLGRAPAWRATFAAISNPLAAWSIFATTLWAWHAPALFQSALRNSGVHVLQHVSFVAAGFIFWRAFLANAGARAGYGFAALAVFTTGVHSSLLGALLTFSNSVWYPVYLSRPRYWGLSGLEDQQLAGLIMWVPAGVVHLGFGILLIALWLRQAEARAQRREGRSHATRHAEAV